MLEFSRKRPEDKIWQRHECQCPEGGSCRNTVYVCGEVGGCSVCVLVCILSKTDSRVIVLPLDPIFQRHGPTVSDRPWRDLFQCPLQRVTVLDNERDPHHSESACHTRWPWQPHCVADKKDSRRDGEKEETLYERVWVYPKWPIDPL